MSAVHGHLSIPPDEGGPKSPRHGDLSLLALIIPYVRRERNLYFLSLVLLPMSILLPLALPRLVMDIVDHRLRDGLSQSLAAGVAMLLGVVILNFIVTYFFQTILRNIGLKIMRSRGLRPSRAVWARASSAAVSPWFGTGRALRTSSAKSVSAASSGRASPPPRTIASITSSSWSSFSLIWLEDIAGLSDLFAQTRDRAVKLGSNV